MRRRFPTVGAATGRRAWVMALLLLTGWAGSGCQTSRKPDLKPYIETRDQQLEPTVKQGQLP